MKRLCIVFFVLISLIFVMQCSNKAEIVETFDPIVMPDSLWSISSIAKWEDGFIILDDARLSLWTFTSTWQVKKEMRLHRGKGPGEVMQPVGLAVVGDSIFLGDWRNNRVSCYDSEGRFSHSFQLPYIYPWLKVRNDTLLILAADQASGKLLHCYSTRGALLDRRIPIKSLRSDLFHLLEKDGAKNVGSLFLPSHWCMAGDTIWLSSRFHYQLKAFVGGRCVMEILGDDSHMVPPQRREFKNGSAWMIQGLTMVDVCQDRLLVRLYYTRHNKVTGKSFNSNRLEIYSIHDGSFLGSRSWILGEDGVTEDRPGINCVLDGQLYYSRGGTLFRGKIDFK